MPQGPGRVLDLTPCTDIEAKDFLRAWPLRPRDHWVRPEGGGPWLRARPNARVAGSAECPDITIIGMSTARTEPDGMYIALGQNVEYADVIAIEHCTTKQNFFDKRSRYMPITYSRAVRLGLAWLTQTEQIEHAGQSMNWSLLQVWPAQPTLDVVVPVRHLRVLYALHASFYGEFVTEAIGAHEFLCLHSSLRHWSNIRAFTARMSRDLHVYSGRVP